jgi:hypothetical protein
MNLQANIADKQEVDNDSHIRDFSEAWRRLAPMIDDCRTIADPVTGKKDK